MGLGGRYWEISRCGYHECEKYALWNDVESYRHSEREIAWCVLGVSMR